jgi:hypothetical protein
MNVDAELGKTFTGFGDSVLLAWVAQATKHSNDPITLYATGPRATLLRSLGQDVTDRPWHLHPTEECFSLDVKAKGCLPRWKIVTELLGLTPFVKQPVLDIPQKTRDWARQFGDDGGRPFVLLFPQCNDHTREWPIAYWRELHSRLRCRLKYPTTIVRKRTPDMGDMPRVLENLPMEQLLALVSEADLVVGNDSFGIHLAGTLGRPTLAVIGPTKATAFAHITEAGLPFYTLASERMGCVGCHGSWPIHPPCSSGCHSLYSLFVDDVFTKTLQILNRHASPTHSP